MQIPAQPRSFVVHIGHCSVAILAQGGSISFALLKVQAFALQTFGTFFYLSCIDGVLAEIADTGMRPTY
jgi:hypothetical protein